MKFQFDEKAFMRKALDSVRSQALEKLSKQVDNLLSDITCDEHGTKPSVKVYDTSSSKDEMTFGFELKDSCCDAFTNQVDSLITIAIENGKKQ